MLALATACAEVVGISRGYACRLLPHGVSAGAAVLRPERPCAEYRNQPGFCCCCCHSACLQEYFIEEAARRCDITNAAVFNAETLNLWLAFWCDMVGALLVGVVSIFAVALKSESCVRSFLLLCHLLLAFPRYGVEFRMRAPLYGGPLAAYALLLHLKLSMHASLPPTAPQRSWVVPPSVWPSPTSSRCLCSTPGSCASSPSLSRSSTPSRAWPTSPSESFAFGLNSGHPGMP